MTRRVLLIAGAGLVLVLIGAGFALRSTGGLAASEDRLLAKMIASKPEDREAIISELGDRGPAVIPGIVAAYEKAADDPVLRTQLATVILRTGPSAQAAAALKGLLEKEKDPQTRDSLKTFVTNLDRSGSARAHPP